MIIVPLVYLEFPKYRGIGLSKILLQYVENQMELKGKKKLM